MQDARVFRSNMSQSFAILVKSGSRKVEIITSTKDVRCSSLNREVFESSFSLSNQVPSHVATVWLGGTKAINPETRTMLETISKTEYPAMPEAQVATSTTPAKAPKLAKPPKAEATPKEPKAPKAPKEPKLDAEGKLIVAKKKVYPLPDYTPDTKIIAVAANNKRGASKDRFAKYVVGMTVAEALAAGVLKADINWDAPRGLIALG